MWHLTSIVVAISAVLASASSAATIREFRVGNWHAGAYTNKATNEFSHCAANASYRSGISVVFSISRNFNWSMNFYHSAWRLRPGSTFKIAFTIDDMSPLIANATALDVNLVQVRLDDSAELFARFRRGQLLRIAAANQIFSFNLAGTSQLLPALLNCVQNRGVEARMASNPFESRTNSSAPRNKNESNANAEATAFAANLLSKAGVKDFTLLSPGDFPEIKGQARWVQGSTFGTMDIFPTVTAEDKENLPGFLIGADAKSCKGMFFSGAIPDDGTGTLARVFTTCQIKKEDKPVTVYYLAVPRKAGGVYVISTVSIGSEKPAKETDAILRSAVFDVLTR